MRGGGIIFNVIANLVDEDQNHPDDGPIKCELNYDFMSSCIIIKAKCFSQGDNKHIKFYLPIISTNDEKVDYASNSTISIHKPAGIVNIETNVAIDIPETENGRIFNFVPGMEAIPIELVSEDIEIKISVS